MRLLFDEQLSEELCALVADVFLNSLHVRTLGAGRRHRADIERFVQQTEATFLELG